MRRLIWAAALGAGLAQAAVAADWRLAGESDRAVSFIDTASIQREGTAARFQRWMVLKAAMASGADNVKDSFAADCGTRTYKVVSAEAFQHDRSVGRLPGAGGTAEPGTVLASLIDVACGARKLDAAPVGDPYAVARARLGVLPQR